MPTTSWWTSAGTPDEHLDSATPARHSHFAMPDERSDSAANDDHDENGRDRQQSNEEPSLLQNTDKVIRTRCHN